MLTKELERHMDKEGVEYKLFVAFSNLPSSAGEVYCVRIFDFESGNLVGVTKFKTLEQARAYYVKCSAQN